jgi:hypothetical protein
VFLTGTRGCDRTGGAVLVAVAPPGRRRFTTHTTVTTAPGNTVRMAVMGSNTVALSWLSGRCSTTEDLGGLPSATVMRGGEAASPTALGDTAATTLIASPAPAGADVTFTAWPPEAPNGLLMSSRLGVDGAIGPPVAAGTWIARAGDPAGDQLVGHPDPAGGTLTSLAARPADGAAIEPAPLAAAAYGGTAGAVAAPDGRALAALWFRPLSSMTPSLVLAVWRP